MILHCKNAEMTIVLSFRLFYSVKSYIYVTRHAKRDLLGSNIVRSEMTFKASQVLTSFSSNYFSRWMSSIGLNSNVTKIFGVKRTRPKTLVANKDTFVCFSQISETFKKQKQQQSTEFSINAVE